MNQDHRHFAEELEELKGRLLTMGGLAEERLRLALRALVDRNHERLADVIAGDSRINDLQIEIDDRCFTLLALVPARRDRSANDRVGPQDQRRPGARRRPRRQHRRGGAALPPASAGQAADRSAADG